ncbi:hypothetical protein ACFWAR_25840 [Streptomyces sp. NPDC059917]|uniref:hypothetical protein n=1 Tax=Streptomyces sp. NPDC059917 TaxID=3347002 RepID=UPI0036669ED9
MRVTWATLIGILTAAVVLGLGATGPGGIGADQGRGSGHQVLADDKGPAGPTP